MNIDKFGFDIFPGTESYDDEVYEEGTEGIRKLWNRHIRGAQKLNKYESAEYYGKLEQYADQLRTHVINELSNSIKEENKQLGIKAKITPFKSNKGGNAGFDEFSSKNNQKSFYILGICTYESDVKNSKEVNKRITECIKKFMKEHKPPVDMYHEIRGNEQHVLIPERGVITGVQESEEFEYTQYAPNLEEGTEGLGATISGAFKSLKSFFNKGCKLFSNAFWDLLFWANDLSAEDYEFIKSKEMKKVGDQIVKEYKSKKTYFDILPITPKNIKPGYFDTDKFDFGSYKYEDFLRLFTTEDDMRAFHYPLCILKLNDKYTLNTLPPEETKKSEEAWTEINKFMEERSPKKFTLVPIPVSDTEMILVYCSPRYKNKNKVITPAGESYNLFEFSNKLEDYNLFRQNPFGFGLESQTIDYNHVFQDCKEMFNSGLEAGLIPIDMDIDTYMLYMDGTEGIKDSVGGFFARGWAKFRRVLHPIIKSDIKLSQEEFNELKAKFQTQIQTAMPGFETKLKENRLIAFLLENGAITINKSVKDAFDNDSRLVSAILVTINSSKIKMDGDSYIVVNGKKKDLMDLRNEDKFFNGADSEGVVYVAINDIITAINKTVYAEIKKEPSLNKLGLAAALLNDGVQTKVKRTGTSVQYDWSGDGGISTRNNYEVEQKNTILEQLQNKNLLIGLRSRPIVIATQAVPAKASATESEDAFNNNYKGGIEMGVRNFSQQIDEIDATVERLKNTPMYQGTETKAPENTIPSGEDATAKEILHRVLDEYGVDGLNRILNKK